MSGTLASFCGHMV